MAILLKYFGKKVDFFSCDFDIFYGSIGCATKFHADEIFIYNQIPPQSEENSILHKNSIDKILVKQVYLT